MIIRYSKFLSILFFAVFLTLIGCQQTLTISKVDYSQPIETVLEPDQQGLVNDMQHGISFNVLPIQYAETGDSTGVTTEQIRMIRGKEGFYYITSAGYQHVYVMAPEESKLKLKKKILIAEEGISQPAFNQRSPFVQLLNRETGENYALTVDGIKKLNNKEITQKETTNNENN